MPPHPLQAALDRVTVALYTSTDLLEIAQTRKKPSGRSDERQKSLYRATVASCVGTLEEAAEALTCEALRCQGINMRLIQVTVARVMQNPHSEGIRELMTGFLDYDPILDWIIRLRTSAPAYRDPKTVGTKTAYNLWTAYRQERVWTGAEAARVMNRFVRVRHAFAHQDSSISLLTSAEVGRVRAVLSKAKAFEPSDVSFVEALNAVCAVRVLNPVGPTDDPVHDWRLHETHALNALFCTLGVISSMTDGLARFLEQNAGVQRAAYDKLQLGVPEGSWAEWDEAVSPCPVGWILQPYKPSQRN
jgi:hypothetical protein